MEKKKDLEKFMFFSLGVVNFVHRCLFDCKNYLFEKVISQVSSCFTSPYRCSADLLDVSLHVSVRCSGSLWEAIFLIL